MKSGGTPLASNKEFYDGNIPFCSISDFEKGYLNKTNKYISDNAIKNSSTFVFQKNNILLSIYATIGEVVINNINVAIPQSILGIIPKNEIDKKYLYYYFQIYKSKKFFKNYSEVGTQPNLSLKTVKKMSITYSLDYKEQIKIGNLMSLLDKQISLWERKLQLYLLIYENTLNKIFNYKDLMHSKTTLSDVVLSKKDKVGNNNYKVATVSNKYGLVDQKDFFGGSLASEDISNYLVVDKNWYAFNPARINVGSIAQNSTNNKYCISPMYSVFESKIETNILNHFFKTKIFLKLVNQKTSGTVRNTLNWEMFETINFLSNENLNKNAKYFKYLDCVNKIVKKIELKIILLKNKKNYFLNKLFI